MSRKPKGGTYEFSAQKLRDCQKYAGLKIHDLQSEFYSRGHRSKVDEYLDGTRAPGLEAFIDICEILGLDISVAIDALFTKKGKGS